MPFVEITGSRLFYSEWGRGRPALFVHAWGLTGDMWAYQVAHLGRAGLRCITVDRRGHGRSDRPSLGYDLDSLADDIAAVIEGLGLDDVLLVAQSMGAAEAVRYLTRHGDTRISGLVLSAPTTPFLAYAEDNPDGVTPEMTAANERELLTDVGAWIDARAAGYWGIGYDVSPALMDWTARQILDTPVHILVETTRAFATADLRGELAALRVPTLVIQGDADTSAPIERTGRPSAALIPDSTLVVLPGAGHGLYISEQSRYNTELLEFATRTGRNSMAREMRDR
ncbi:alpha/beta fold hydrolase [Pseudonocardia spinosispora]|uniref:alpha/beta fold hydrolase n=1 Tax=Pseudonocardia spinosispora TaxID=103441 RepID=UPI0004082D47|nr:alpha/beta hydrolase [Pseudonocardia spinosispora]